MGAVNKENTLFLITGFVLVSICIILHLLNKLNLTRVGLLFDIAGVIFLYLYVGAIKTNIKGLVPAVSIHRSFGPIGIIFLIVGFVFMFIGSFL